MDKKQAKQMSLDSKDSEDSKVLQDLKTPKTKNTESKLNLIRHDIDKIDKQIASLLNQRLEYVKQIGEIKLKSKASIYRPDREREILKKLGTHIKEQNLANLNDSILEAIFYEIFAISRNVELPQRVAFLGPIGSYTQEAAESIFGPLSAYIGLSSITAVFEALENKNAKHGVIPIENNTNGMVGESIDNLAKYDFKIIKELVLPVHHCLASSIDDINAIARIYSKDIAFGQCSHFLQNYRLNNIERVETSSTALAALSATKDSKGAAICSKIAARLHKLPILFDNVQNFSHNKTRFVVISDFYNERGSSDKTSIFVTIKDFERSGALFELLKDFKEEDINITKIDSRPISDKTGFKYGFYMDFDGHKDDENVQRIFKKRKGEIKWLGSYPGR